MNLDKSFLSGELKKIWKGNLYLYRELESTQIVAKELAEKGEEEGSVVLAERQTQGRGRGKNRWYSPPGGLYFTLILRPPIERKKINCLSFVFSLSVAEKIYDFTRLLPQIKWPNDILINRRKVCGMLIEAKGKEKISYVLAGIGVNVNSEREDFPPPLRETLTTLKEETTQPLDLENFFLQLLKTIHTHYEELKAGFFSDILGKWQRFSLPSGERIEFTSSQGKIKGILWGVDEEGYLHLRTQDGKIITVREGEVVWLP